MRASHGGPSHFLRPSRYGVCVPLISNFLGWRDDRRVESRVIALRHFESCGISYIFLSSKRRR